MQASPSRRILPWPIPGPSAVSSPDLLRPVAGLGLEEDHRVGIGDRQAQQPVGVQRRGGNHHLQPGRVHVVGLGALAVVLLAPDAAERRDPDRDRHVHAAPRALAHLRDVVDDLLERRVGEGVELHLDDRSPPREGETHRRADDAGLADRCVEHALDAELLLQPLRDAEDPAHPPDVLSVDQYARVLVHRVAKRRVQRRDHRELRHRPKPPGVAARTRPAGRRRSSRTSTRLGAARRR